MSTPASFNRTAISLHWLVAGLVICSFSLGWVMTDLAVSPLKVRMFNWHKWVGVTILGLTAIRLLWRLTHPAPPPLSMPAWQRVAASVSHAAMYVLLLALPLSGWTYSNAAGYPIVYLGLLPLPDLVEKNKELAEQWLQVHEVLGWALASIVILHLLAVLKHQFIDRDGTLGRMWRWGPTVLVVTLITGSAFAVDNNIDAAPSTIIATFKQEGVPVEAPFTEFTGHIIYKPDDIAGSTATIEVATGSLDLGDQTYNEEVLRPEWFDSANQPNATFQSTSIETAGGGAFQATGDLTIKSVTQTITVLITVGQMSDQQTFDGTLEVSRKAFGIGEPMWDEVLEDTVAIRFHLVSSTP